MRTIIKIFLLILFFFDSMLYNCIYTQKKYVLWERDGSVTEKHNKLPFESIKCYLRVSLQWYYVT